ncbi:MAG: putative bifunctional diguanylate cyclase/phosphodiesterase [Janthinobacterium lividum]
MTPRLSVGHLKVCEGQIVWADEDAHHLLGYLIGALADMPFGDVVVPELEATSTAPGDHAMPALGAVDCEGVTLQTGNGVELRVDMRGERTEDGCTLWTFSKAASEMRAVRLGLLSRHDALTRLPNRVPAIDELQMRLAGEGSSRMLAVFYLDLDRFRDINESFGPVGGDVVLREVARRLKAAVPHDAIVARVGGDEFALVLSFAGRKQCEALLQQILARLAHPFRLQDRLARVRASVGVALGGYGEQPTEVMLQHAQHAVFFAKRASGSRVHFFDADQALEEQEGMLVRQRIAEALAREEFWLAYQPKVDMRCGHVIGFEALIRWQHPERGLVQPASFIPLIEDHELVEQIGDWVIGEALRQAADWQARGVTTSISVNISPRHMQRPDFIETLAAHLSRFPQLQVGVLELEILETTAIKDFTTAANFVEDCQVLGVPVTMDDFGTGYSSLTYLRRLPVSALKLDQSFVRGVLDNAEDQAIVKGILLLAQGLGRKAVAEGVESVAHGRALMKLGCTLGQGYGIARPMPPGDVPNWIAGFEAEPLWGRAQGC